MRVPFVGEEERGERKEIKITKMSQHTNILVTLNSNIIPSILKNIVVSQTMLMHLINIEQWRLSS